MPAAVTDKFKKISDGSDFPNVARVASPRATSGTTLSCDDLSGWAEDTGVSFITYQLDTANTVVAGSITAWEGVVSGNSITNLTRVKGAADGGSAINDVVMMAPDSNWADDLVDGLLVSHDQDGTLKSGAVDVAAVMADKVATLAKIHGGSTAGVLKTTAGGDVTAAPVAATDMSTSAIKLGAATPVTTSQTVTTIGSDVPMTGYSLATTIPAGGRDVEITAVSPQLTVTGATVLIFKLWTGSVGGTLLQSAYIKMQDSGDQKPLNFVFEHTPSSGSLTYYMSVSTSANNVTLNHAAGKVGQLYAKVI